MNKYVYKITKGKKAHISVLSPENKKMEILNTFIMIDININIQNTLTLLNNINSILDDKIKTYKWCGEICAIYLYKETSMIVDTLSGFNYDDNYSGYDFFNVTPPDICDYEEIDTIELKEILKAWHDAIINT